MKAHGTLLQGTVLGAKNSRPAQRMLLLYNAAASSHNKKQPNDGGLMRRTFLALAVALVLLTSFADAQEKNTKKAASTMSHEKMALSDAQYTRVALSAAPSSVSKDAGIMRSDTNSDMKTLRESKNGFTCMVAMGQPMCADANSMAFFGAWMKHENPSDKDGITYMLRGDNGASNTDPYATRKTADNHWVATGPHIMVVGPGAKSMGLPDSADADPTKPYLMWANTPYAHAMIPVAETKSRSKASTASAQKQE
jgi:hypothetical protein